MKRLRRKNQGQKPQVPETKVPAKRKGLWLLSVFVFVWPLLYLFRDIVPIQGKYVSIGNDFIYLYYKYKVYLLAHLADGQLPLWSPSEAGGYPFFSSSFTQVFYPFNLILIFWYKVFGGYSPLDHQLYTILGISIFSLGLFFWLRLLSDNLRAVLFSVLVMSVSFKVTELLRFPNAVHTMAWYPWILYSITRIFYGRSKKEFFFCGLMLVFFVYNLATAGYPYNFYYAIFLFVPYAALFFLPSTRKSFFGTKTVHWRQSLVTLFLSGGLSLAIIAPYFLFVKSMLSQTVDRGGKNFGYSTSHVFNIKDTIGSLVYPPFSQAEGWYFFSITALLLILLYLLAFYRNRPTELETPENEPAGFWQKWGFRLVLLFWLCVISDISYGRYSVLFKFLWNYMPGFSQMRVWGRLNIIMVPLLAWLLCRAYADFESRVFSGRLKIMSCRLNAWLVLGIAYLLILGTQLYLYLNNFQDSQWERYFKHVWSHRIFFIIGGTVAFLLIAVCLQFGKTLLNKTKHAPVILLLAFCFVASAEMWPVGTRAWVNPEKAAVKDKRADLDVNAIYQTSFRAKRVHFKGNLMLGPVYNTGIIPNWFFGRYVQFLNKFEKETQERAYLLGLIDGRKVFFSESLQHETVRSFLQDSFRFKQPGRLISYDGDNLIWQIEVPQGGYLSFIDNWDPYWKVFVDDTEEPIQLLFGTFKAVHLTKGIHQVHFTYRPSLKAGICTLFNHVQSEKTGTEDNHGQQEK